ncbi:Fe-S cluster assembly protein SufD [Blattabacterium cuenoti]|uniref:Fe-S cluster assembly protein SufD n=1 Tax=Blattabacterium cuenoti TaxID=1653831 RepID=UPI00163BACD8|nr:Fe-S cluster assembly protein SufD [Blattabacterium cuenoti]
MKLKNNIYFLISEIENSLETKKSYISYLKKKHIQLLKKNGLFYSTQLNKNQWSLREKDIHDCLQQKNFFYEKNHDIEYKKIEKFLLLKKDHSFLFVLINGQYNNSISEKYNKSLLNKSIILSNIKSQKEEHLKKYYGKLDDKDNNGFYSINTIFSNDGLYIKIPDNTILKKPIEIISISTGLEPKVTLHTRNLIIVGKHSYVKIIEHFKSLKKHSVLLNSVNEIYSDYYSKINYYKIQDDLKETLMIDNTFVKQKKYSKCHHYTFSFESKIIKNYLNFYSCGEKTFSYLYGISLLSKKQCVYHHTLINHLSSNSYSDQLYKNILSYYSNVFFHGKIHITKLVKGINAFQKNNNILLSEQSKVYAKPELKIYAKNVKCSHGCTVGYLKEEELFYLQSRGINEKEGKKIILYSFMNDLLDHIDLDILKKCIYKKINKKLKQSL